MRLLKQCKEEGVSAKKFVLTAVKNYLIIRRFRNLRKRLKAETIEEINDEEIFDLVS